MGFLDKARNAVGDAANRHGDKVADGLDKTADFADRKTGGKYRDQLDKGVASAKNTIDKLGKRDDGTR